MQSSPGTVLGTADPERINHGLRSSQPHLQLSLPKCCKRKHLIQDLLSSSVTAKFRNHFWNLHFVAIQARCSLTGQKLARRVSGTKSGALSLMETHHVIVDKPQCCDLHWKEPRIHYC